MSSDLAGVTGAAYPGCPVGAGIPAERLPAEPGGATDAVNKGGVVAPPRSAGVVAAGGIGTPAERLPAERLPAEPGVATDAANKGGLITSSHLADVTAAGNVDTPAERLDSATLGDTTGVDCGTAAIAVATAGSIVAVDAGAVTAASRSAEPGGATDAAGHIPFGNSPLYCFMRSTCATN